MRQCDPTRECSVCPQRQAAPNQSQGRATDAQRRPRLDELAKARRQLDEELALLHQEYPCAGYPRAPQPTTCIGSPYAGAALLGEWQPT
jgi:hypothetical protein